MTYKNKIINLYNEVFEELKEKNVINFTHEIEIYFPTYKDDCYMKANATKFYYRIDVFIDTILTYEITEEDIKDIFKHELVHLIEFERTGGMTGHGKIFKNLCVEIWSNKKLGNATL